MQTVRANTVVGRVLLIVLANRPLTVCLPALQLLTMTSSERIMGKPFTNTQATQIVGWAVAAGVMAVNASDIWDAARGALQHRKSLVAPFLVAVLLYLAFIAYLTIGPER